MSMLEQQNSPENLELLAAMRHYYNRAKSLHRINVGISILLSLASIYLARWYPQAKEWIVGIAGFWLFCSWFFSYLEKQLTRIAATIQEQFDTDLFGIPWNQTLVGDRIAPEKIRKASKRLKEDRNQLKNWYTGLNCTKKELNVLLAQRTNLIWDSNQRKKYAIAVGIITIMYLAFTIVIGWNTSLGRYLLTLFLPSAPILIHGLKTVLANWTRAKQCESLAKDEMTSFEFITCKADSEIWQKCRQYQDIIYQKRCDTTLVPNWWYKLWRTENEDTMRAINEQMSNKAM